MSQSGVLVAARKMDGTVIKGFASEFDPRSDLRVIEDGGGAEAHVPVSSLKAVFFIKDFQGDPSRRKTHEFADNGLLGTRIWIRFKDGEEMAGLSQSFKPGKDGFYVFPTDPGSNIEMAFVFRHALTDVLQAEAAEAAAEAYAKRLLEEPGAAHGAHEWGTFIDAVR